MVLLHDAPPSAVPGIAALRDVARNSLAPSLVLEAGPAFRVAHANPACCEAACLAEGAMLGRPLREALPGLHAALPPGALEALAGGARRHLRAWLPAAPLRAGAAAAPVGLDRPPGAGAAQAAPAAPQGDGGLWMLEAAPLHGEGPEGAVAGLFLQLHPAAAGAEEASTRATLDALFEHIPEGLVLADAPDARIRRVSAHALRLVGRAAAEVLDHAAADHPQDWQVLHLDGVTPAAPEALPLTRAVRHGETVQQESWMLRRADGALLTILCSAGPIRGAGDGRIAGGILAFRDVSEMRRTETRLVRSEARYRALVEAGALAVWTAGPDGAMRGAAAWCALTGQAPAEAAGEGWLEAVLAEDRDAVRLCWGEALLAGTVFEAECRVRTARDEAGSGGWCWVLLRAVPVVRGSAAVEAPLGAAPGGGPARAAEGGGGAIAEWIGAATDIHARRMAEEAMRASQERFRTLAEAMPHLVWQTDADGTPDYMNRRMQEFTGLRPGAGAARARRGQGWLATVHPEDAAALAEAWGAALAEGGEFELDARLRGGAAEGAERNGWRWFRVRGAPVRDARTGRVRHWVGTCTDVEDRHRATAERQAALEAQEELTRTAEHRIKNSLQLVAALLRLKASRMGHEPAARDALTAGVARVQAVAEAHRALQKSPDMRSVRVADILAELAAGTSVLHPGADLRTEADAALMLDADRAIPLTLVLNELVAAALSSGEEGAVVRLSAAATGDGGGVAVTVTGLGAWPPPMDAVGGAGDLAETMVRGLLRQIGATLEVRAEDGAAVVAVPGEAAGGTAAAAAPAA